MSSEPFMINVPVSNDISRELQAMHACEYVLLHLLPRKVLDTATIERIADTAARERVVSWLFQKYGMKLSVREMTSTKKPEKS